jgi:DNA-binding transcriptional LysR family regulator
MVTFSVDFTIDIRRLRVLRELRDRGTLAATAEALNLTPSAVSQQIANLGRETGIPLLVRQGRGVRLTPQALLLLEHAALLDAQMERARADLAAFNEGLAGRVVIGSFATAITCLVAPALVALRKSHPRLAVSVVEVEAPDCFTRLHGGDLDVALAVDYPGGPLRHDPRYSRRDLLHDPFHVALPARHRLASRKTLEMAELAGEVWVLGGGASGPCQAASLAACTGAGFTPDVRFRTSDWMAAFGLVAAGCGVALIPRLALPPALPRGVVLKSLSGRQRPSRHVYAAIRAGSDDLPSLSPVLGALQAVARELCESQ